MPQHQRACVCAVVFAAAVPLSAGTPAFSNRTTDALIDAFQIPFGYPPLGTMMGGGAVADFNRDGWMDFYAVRGSFFADCLYLNNGDETFTNHATAAGMDDILFSAGVAVGDFDNDGWIDIFLMNHGDPTSGDEPGRHRLYRNNGDGTFTDVASIAGVETSSPFIADGFGAAFGDYDLDGDLDLAVSGWIPGAQGNRLYRNDGDGTFADVTSAAVPASLSSVRGFSIRFTDMDGDRFPELLWVGDYVTSRYFRNNADGTFADVTAASGTALDENGMGSIIGDFNGDGLFDWFVTAIYGETVSFPFVAGNRLYLNQGNHTYTEVAAAAGVDDGGWGWGATAIDIDHDGDQDLVHTNGWPTYDQYIADPTRVYVNDGNANFTEQAAALGLTHTGSGRGLANLDYDNDGDQDVLIFAYGEKLAFFRNDLFGPDTNWIRLLFDTSNEPTLAPDGFGTHAAITTGAVTQVRQMDGGCNYLSVSEFSVHAGLGAASTIDEILVTWANGRQNRLVDVAANQTLTISPCLISGDADADGVVDFADLNLVLQSWGMMVEPWRDGDATGDGDVDFSDLNAVLAEWGSTCP